VDWCRGCRATRSSPRDAPEADADRASSGGLPKWDRTDGPTRPSFPRSCCPARRFRQHGSCRRTHVQRRSRSMDRVEVSRTILKAISRLYVLPWFRVIGGPRSTRWGGSLCVLRTRGRRTGRIREVPLDYAPAGDGIYVLAGLGDRTHWLSNLRADPHVEVQFGRRLFPGIACEVTTPAERLVAVRSLLTRACGGDPRGPRDADRSGVVGGRFAARRVSPRPGGGAGGCAGRRARRSMRGRAPFGCRRQRADDGGAAGSVPLAGGDRGPRRARQIRPRTRRMLGPWHPSPDARTASMPAAACGSDAQVGRTAHHPTVARAGIDARPALADAPGSPSMFDAAGCCRVRVPCDGAGEVGRCGTGVRAARSA